MFVEHYDYIHPDLEFIVIGLDEKIISARDFALELALVQDLYFLFFLTLACPLQVRDSVSQFLQEDFERVFDGLVSGNMNPISEIISEIRSLKHYIIIPFRFHFDPGSGILHAKAVFLACEQLEFLAMTHRGDCKNSKY